MQGLLEAIIIPPFFRYSYIMGGVGYKNNIKRKWSVHGYMFQFGGCKERFNEVIRTRVKNIFYSISPDWGNYSTFEGEECEQVDVEEVRGVGFYYPRILINDTEVEKADVRYGLWRVFFTVVEPVLRGLFG